MGNPRIVAGRRGSGVFVAARGHVLGVTFLLAVSRDAAGNQPRLRLEDRLLDEARSLMRRAERDDSFDWEHHRFVRDADFAMWVKRLTREEVEQLMRG